MGVQRAVRMVLDASDEPGHPRPIKTYGPLIHNRQVLRVLEKRGVTAMDDASDDDAGTVVVRAHGLSHDVLADLKRRYPAVVDATCPHVRRVQEILRDHARKGYTCVVVGDSGHAEVEALLSYAGGSGRVIAGPDEVDGLPEGDRVVVVAQTTQDEQLFRRAIEKLRSKYPGCVWFDTICGSTQQRQREARELADQVEAMIVVGGYHSANTRRLAQISASTGTPTYHVETERELDVDGILRYRKVGLTAGASTPHWMIRKVVRRLTDEHRRRTNLVGYAATTLARGLVASNVYAAGAAGSVAFAFARLLPGPTVPPGLCAAIAFFFVLAQQLLNQFVRRESLYLSEPDRADFFMLNERALLMLGVCSSLLSLLLAFVAGWWPLGLVASGSAAGVMYRMSFPHGLARRFGLRSMEQLPGSKELFVGLAWATLAALVPALGTASARPHPAAVAVAFGAAFLLACQRTLLMDLRDVATDKIVGRETLARLLGARTAGPLCIGLTLAVGAVLVLGGCVAGWTSSACYPILLGVPYGLACHGIVRRPGGRVSEQELLAEAVVDGQFYVIGAAALAWGVVGA